MEERVEAGGKRELGGRVRVRIKKKTKLCQEMTREGNRRRPDFEFICVSLLNLVQNYVLHYHN
jgi:hypothetical protein